MRLALASRIAIATCVAVCGLAAGMGDDNAGVVARAGVLNLRVGDVAIGTLPSLLGAAAFEPQLEHVIVLDGAMTPERSAALSALGGGVDEYLPTNAFASRVAGVSPAALRALGFVTGVYVFDEAWKVAPDLGVRVYTSGERQQIALQGRSAAAVSLFSGRPVEGALAAIRAIAGVQVLSFDSEGGAFVIWATLPAGSERTIASLPDVQFIDDMTEIVERNLAARWIVQSNVSGQYPLTAHGLTGLGEIVGVIDGGLDPNHCSFLDAVNPVGPLHRKIEAWNGGFAASSHGTHVAGTVLGDAGAENNTRGHAYGARLVFNYYPSINESSLYNRFDLHRSQGAFVHNNSWGNDNTTQYDVLCRAIDNFLWTHDDNFIAFAVSNGATITNPENAKNSLAVAASGGSGSQHNFCYGGTGPTPDGRRKPEVMAPGCSIPSAWAGTACLTTSMSGTSMATPAVSGVATLMHQYFASGYYPSGSPSASDAFAPSGALIKACLANSAVDMTGIAGFPSNREGWGRILADNVLYFPGDARQLIVRQAFNNQGGALSTGQTAQLRVRVRSSTQPLKATMTFFDAPAAVSATSAPINDLDLLVDSLPGDVLVGNNFSGGFSRDGGSPDPLNNLEQILVATPTPGTWLVRVPATAVNVGQQGYALVISGDVEVLCPADFNGDGAPDFFDYDEFVMAFEAGTPFADYDGDGTVDFFDYDAFVVAFEVGC